MYKSMGYYGSMVLGVYGIFDEEYEALDMLTKVVQEQNNDLSEEEIQDNEEVFWCNSRVEKVLPDEKIIFQVFINNQVTEYILLNHEDGMDETYRKYSHQEKDALYITESLQEILQSENITEYHIVKVYFDNKYNFIKSEF
ncbi:MAG: hypothetical protein ACRCW1_00580 [Anaerotignaceae bacterium]